MGSRVEVGAALVEQPDDRAMTEERGLMQASRPVPVAGVRECRVLGEQALDLVDVSGFDGSEER